MYKLITSFLYSLYMDYGLAACEQQTKVDNHACILTPEAAELVTRAKKYCCK